MRGTVPLIFFILIYGIFSSPIQKTCLIEKYKNNTSVKLLQKYIQINTSKKENLEIAVKFWKRQATAIGLPISVYRPASKPVCVITWTGKNKTLPSIVVNSHLDVVPVEQQNWSYSPFSGFIDTNGDMYGRGTQDTKSLSITYLEAIKQLRNENIQLYRTLHLLLMPDEETGGFEGMIPFIQTDEFRALNPGFFFDDGLSDSSGMLYASYQDKRSWQLNFTIHGAGGHGSSLPNGTAMEKVRRLLDIVYEFREQQKQIMMMRAPTDFGSYTTVNVDVIEGGIFTNVIPTRVSVVIDMRLAASAQIKEVEAMIRTWIEQVGNDTELSFIRKVEISKATRLDKFNAYWVAVVEALREMNINVLPIVFPATSDMVEIRNQDFPAIGLAYRPYTESRIHAADEYINIVTFLKGINVYANIIKKVCNLK